MKTSKRFLSLVLAFAVALSILSLSSCAKAEPEIIREEKYTVYKNYSYGRHQRQVFDLCLPSGASGEIGLVFFIHGGAWAAGDKDLHEGDLRTWAERGYAAAALNYRYADGRITVDDILSDITDCLSEISALAATEESLKINAVLLGGGSAGGHLALMYAYKMHEISPIPPVAVISYAGPTELADENFYKAGELRDSLDKALSKISGAKIKDGDFEKYREKLDYASPTTYVGAHCVPTLICHGALDDVVPVSNAYTLAECLGQYGITHDLIIFPNSSHGLEADPECSDKANGLFIKYAEKYLKGNN